MKKIDWLALILLLLIGVFGVKALFQPGFYTSHDGEHQVIRLIHFVKGLKDGQLPVRWAGPPAFDGYGYPLFIFIYRFPFYLGTFFHLIGLSFIDSIKAVFILTYVLSGLAMYLTQKKLWSNRLAAFTGAVFCLWTPWRFSTILVRASLGEAVCFLFLPLLIWAVLAKKPIFGGIFLACLFLSHMMLAFLFLPFLLVLIIFFLYQRKDKKAFIIHNSKFIILALALSAFYWLPALVEKKETMFSQEMMVFYRDHFPSLKQLIYSSWGYGLSHPGTELDAMSFQVGIAQWLAVALAVLVWWRQRQRLLGLLIVFFFSAVFLMLPVANPYWQAISFFLKIDFPFRYLALTTLFSSLITGGVLTALKKKTLFLPLTIFLLALTFYGNRNHLRVNLYQDLTDDYFLNKPATSNSYNEYRPRWSVSGKHEGPRQAVLEAMAGEVEVLSEEVHSHWQKYRVKAVEDSQVRLNTVYYPGWRLWVSTKGGPASGWNGQKRKFDITLISGLIQFPLEEGEHEVMIKFTRTWDRILGEAISCLSLLFLVGRGLKSFMLK